METPPSSTPSDTADPRTAAVAVEQRKQRAVLSCSNCRNRKLRCDRCRPCQNCSKRKQACRYYSFAPTGKNASAIALGRSPRPVQDLDLRLQHLEDLLVVLNNQHGPLRRKSSSISDTESRSSQACFDQGHVHGSTVSPKCSSDAQATTQEEVHNIAPGQWQAVLDDISELRSFLLRDSLEDGTNRTPSKEAPLDAPVLLLHMIPPVAKSDLLASLPPKSIVDDLIVGVFSSGEPAIIILHVPTLMKEYDDFWNDPESLPIAWLGKLFGLICLATLLQRRRGVVLRDPLENQQESVDFFRMRAAQCLCMANYTRPGPHKIEALIVYMAAEYFKSKDAQLGVSMVLGIIVRLSMSIGYHRDPDRDPKISVFEAEMIRRRWAFIKQVVGLTSFQMGLPTMIHHAQTDTRPPHNLLDTDFDQSTSILPPERPVQEYTPISYIIAKERMVKAFAVIVDSFNTSKPVSYKGIVQLDMHLQRIRSTLPPSFQMHRPSEAGPEPIHLVMKRYFLEILFLKGRCVLHRQYLMYATTEVWCSASRSTCLEASRQILRHQAEIFRQTQPGGALSADSWVLLSLTTSDFLLAAMIICLCISQQRQLTDAGQNPMELGFPTSEEMIASLMHELDMSQRIWISLSQKSAEAGRAAEAISLMLAQANAANQDGGSSTQSSRNRSSEPLLSMPAANVFSTGFDPERLNPSLDTRTGFDWETWDRYFQLPPPEVPPANVEAAGTVTAHLPFKTTLPQELPSLDAFSDLNFEGNFGIPGAGFGMPC